jgi:hypothetical protein
METIKIIRVSVVDAEDQPLMPTTPARARLLLKTGKAVARWSKLGVFYLQLKTAKEPANQPLAVGVDPGSKFEAVSVVGTKDTVLNVMSEAVDWVKDAVKQRRQMRRARRSRNTRRRRCKSNRLGRGLPPSTRARWNAKLRIITQLQKILPISTAVVEDVKARTKRGQKRWNAGFSPLGAGKQHFYSELAKTLQVTLKQGYETKKLRRRFHLKKLRQKSAKTFESHCVDSWALAASETGAKQPTTKSLYYLVPLRWHRRQLHRLQPKNGARGRYGGTQSLGLKKGTLVRHAGYGLCYVGGNAAGRFSLHDPKTGRRLTQTAKRGDFTVLTRIAFRSQFLSRLKTGVSLRG